MLEIQLCHHKDITLTKINLQQYFTILLFLLFCFTVLSSKRRFENILVKLLNESVYVKENNDKN